MDKNLINKIKNEKINYIVEWWEEDSLDIDSNQHILFSLENEDIDIIITEKNIDEINFVLEKFNVNISMEFHVNFFDRIIYPISRYGEKYYEYKYGCVLNKILKFIGIRVCKKGSLFKFIFNIFLISIIFLKINYIC